MWCWRENISPDRKWKFGLNEWAQINDRFNDLSESPVLTECKKYTGPQATIYNRYARTKCDELLIRFDRAVAAHELFLKFARDE
jgi:hypothetical protein